MAGPARVGRHRRRRHRADRVPVPHGEAAGSIRAPEPVPVTCVHFINLATFFIYGALYVTFLYQALVLQGVLGYTALAAGAVGIPSGLMLSLLSTRIGTVAGRTGARRFLVAGPTIMALGLLWWARLPADSAPWLATISIPPRSSRRRACSSTSCRRSCCSGPASHASSRRSPRPSWAPCRAASRASRRPSTTRSRASGSPLMGAIIFIVVSATFYSVLGSLLPGIDTTSARRPVHFQPLNPPPAGASPPRCGPAPGVHRRLPRGRPHQCRPARRSGAAVSFVGLRETRAPPDPGRADQAGPAVAGG